MTLPCPDWRALTAHRDATPATGEPAGWWEALEHLDGCPACRRAALLADPTLLFRRLPALPAPVLELSPAAEAAEVEAIRQAVAGMRTAQRLAPPRERTISSRYRRWGAAAALAVAALSLGSAHPLRPGAAANIADAANIANIANLSGLHGAAPLGGRGIVPAVTPRLVSERVPMVEELNRPAARVYQMDGGENLSVVMIVDERLDV
jgi:hypothetical protein